MTPKQNIHDTPLEKLLMTGVLNTERAYSYSWDDICIGASITKNFYEPKVEALQLRLNAVEEENDRLRQVLQLARSSHGVFLATDPPRDAWKYNQVSEKIAEALEKRP